jgi:cytochrome P450
MASASVGRCPPLLRRLLQGIGGDNLMTLKGDAWLARRRLVQPCMRRSEIAALAEEILVPSTAHSTPGARSWETQSTCMSGWHS